MSSTSRELRRFYETFSKVSSIVLSIAHIFLGINDLATLKAPLLRSSSVPRGFSSTFNIYIEKKKKVPCLILAIVCEKSIIHMDQAVSILIKIIYLKSFYKC